MPLVDLAYTPKERKEEVAEAKAYEPPEYPWGLSIRLEDDELKKLGVKAMPPIGEEFHFEVLARVTAVSENAYADGRQERCVSLQICQMGMDDEAAEDKAKPAAAPPPRQPRRAALLGD